MPGQAYPGNSRKRAQGKTSPQVVLQTRLLPETARTGLEERPLSSLAFFRPAYYQQAAKTDPEERLLVDFALFRPAHCQWVAKTSPEERVA